jgi:hypothetical protein
MGLAFHPAPFPSARFTHGPANHSQAHPHAPTGSPAAPDPPQAPAKSQPCPLQAHYLPGPQTLLARASGMGFQVGVPRAPVPILIRALITTPYPNEGSCTRAHALQHAARVAVSATAGRRVGGRTCAGRRVVLEGPHLFYAE